jgi:hypothetical protein
VNEFWLSCNLRPFFGAERFYPPNKIVSAGLDNLGIDYSVADLAKPEVAADIDAFRHGRTGRATDPQLRSLAHEPRAWAS